jgi:D-alanyl-D-alanine carboxypeptidase
MLAVVLALHALLAPALAQATGRHAVLVIDANTGRILYQSSADERRFPASLVKLMTLYLIFEAIESGRLSYRTTIRFSANATEAAPSRLGVEEGAEISLLDAIKALITKSANDVAVAVAEHIGGSEERFAQMMTQKARQLGMNSTTFRNASGLPDAQQVTTARDMITLALRLQDDFPRHYPLFATRTFTFNGDTFRNHNTLLFNFEGLDGMKTGYTRASGFNLVASVRRGRKHVVAVVFGGATASARNSAMRTYLTMGLLKASNEKTRQPAPRLVAREKGISSIAVPAPRPAVRPPAESPAPNITMARVRPVPVPGGVKQPPPASIDAILKEGGSAAVVPPPPPAETKGAWTTAAIAPEPSPGATGAFHIQIGAYQSQSEAERRLASVRELATALLGNRTPVTAVVKQGERTFYRARYGGFDAQSTAAGVCGELKRMKIDCLVMRAE